MFMGHRSRLKNIAKYFRRCTLNIPVASSLNFFGVLKQSYLSIVDFEINFISIFNSQSSLMKTIVFFIVTLTMQYWDEVKILTRVDVVETFIFNLLLF